MEITTKGFKEILRLLGWKDKLMVYTDYISLGLAKVL
jgi:hypothetical protein